MPNSSQPNSDHPVLENRVTSLEVTVGGIKTDVAHLAQAMASSHDKLSSQISGLGEKLVQTTVTATTTDWKTLTGFGMLLLAIIGGVASLSKAPMDAALMRADGDIRELGRNIVPRSEHQEKWREQSRRDDRLFAVIDQMRKDLYGPKFKLKDEAKAE